MNEKELAKMAKEFAKNIKTTDDLTSLTSMLTKQVIEAALGAEMEEHLGYSKNQQTDKSNARNGYTKKILKGSHGEIQIATPRDRNGSFEPELIKKRQNRLTQFDEQITYLYGKGMTTRLNVFFIQSMILLTPLRSCMGHKSHQHWFPKLQQRFSKSLKPGKHED